MSKNLKLYDRKSHKELELTSKNIIIPWFRSAVANYRLCVRFPVGMERKFQNLFRDCSKCSKILHKKWKLGVESSTIRSAIFLFYKPRQNLAQSKHFDFWILQIFPRKNTVRMTSTLLFKASCTWFRSLLWEILKVQLCLGKDDDV